MILVRILNYLIQSIHRYLPTWPSFRQETVEFSGASLYFAVFKLNVDTTITLYVVLEVTNRSGIAQTIRVVLDSSSNDLLLVKRYGTLTGSTQGLHTGLAALFFLVDRSVRVKKRGTWWQRLFLRSPKFL